MLITRLVLILCKVKQIVESEAKGLGILVLYLCLVNFPGSKGQIHLAMMSECKQPQEWPHGMFSETLDGSSTR